jgi:Ca-activated chloride channel family protein
MVVATMRFDPLLPVPVLIALIALAVTAVWVCVRRGSMTRTGLARWSAMGVLLVVVAADPALGAGSAAVKRSDANVLFVVDTTGSMAAEDYNGGEPRLAGVRHDVAALADEFPGAHFSLVTFNSKTRVIVPWTTDRGALDSATQLLRQEWTLYAQGTRLDEPLPTMREVLPRAGPSRGYDVVFFLSDGEQTEQPAPQSFEPLGDIVAGGAVLGYGTTDGATMHVYIGHDEDPEQYITDDETGADAVSRIDEANLVTIADELGVSYVHRTVPDDVDDVAGTAADQAGSIYAGERDTLRRLYWLPAFGLIGLVLWQLARTVLEIVDDRRMLDASATRGPT